MRKRAMATLMVAALMTVSACGSDDDTSDSASATVASEVSVTTGDSVSATEPATSNSPNTSAAGEDTAASGDPYKIGVIAPLSGVYSYSGGPWLAGIQTYMAGVNAAGGIDGHPVEFEPFDHNADVGTAQSALVQLADDDHVLGLMGEYFSNIIASIAPQAAKEGLLYVTGTDVADLTNPPQDLIYSTNLPTVDLADVELNFIESELLDDLGTQTPKVGVYAIDTAGGVPYRERAKELIAEKGWEYAGEQVTAQAATDVSAQMALLLDQDPDVIIGYHTAPIPALTALRQRNEDVPFVNIDGGESVFGQFKDPAYFAVRDYVDPEDDSVPRTEEMRAQAEEAGLSDEITDRFYFTHGYVSGMMLEAALTACGAGCDRAGLAEAWAGLGEFDSDGLTGPIVVSPDEHRMVRTAKVYVWDDATGRSVPVTADWLGAAG